MVGVRIGGGFVDGCLGWFWGDSLLLVLQEIKD